MSGARSVGVAVLDLLDRPGGTRQRQKLMGERVEVMAEGGADCRIRAEDGYEGWVAAEALVAAVEVTHRVAGFATHLYEADDMKTAGPVARSLPFGAKVRVTDERRRFYETPEGFIPKTHLRPLDRPFADPVTVAQLHFNVPYLWGGDSTRGIDCSGLVQAALRACDIPCPGDSGPQREALGRAVEDAPQRGDLVFWTGHVGMMVDGETMIHANAHAMACVYEPLDRAILRIEAQGDGPVLVRKRLG